MLAKVWRSESSARLMITTRLIHRSVATTGTVSNSRPSLRELLEKIKSTIRPHRIKSSESDGQMVGKNIFYEGDELESRNEFHNVTSFDADNFWFDGLLKGEELQLRSGTHYIKRINDAISLFDVMVRSRPFHSTVDFNKLMGVILRMNRPEVVISLYRKMEMQRIPFDSYSMNILINCFCSCSQSSSALSTLAKMTKLGFQPHIVAFNKLINGLCLEDRILEAVALLDRMVRNGHEPNVVTYGTIVNGMCKMEDTVSALDLLRKMKDIHIKPNDVIYSAIIDRLCKDGDYNDARNLFREMRDKGIMPNELTYKCMIDAFVKEGKFYEAEEFHNKMMPRRFREPGGFRFPPNSENMIFKAALQDLTQPNDEASLPDGVLTVPLMRHQRIALSWMSQKETSGTSCSGGILADDQGLGKTISTIALILKERSTPAQARDESESGKCAPLKPAAGTLVVCPTSVMRQWANELHNKVASEANLSVLVYHGSSRTKDPRELAKYDVVVTTYSIVSMEVPKQPLVDDEDGGAAGVCSNKNPLNSQKKKGSKKKKHVESLSGPLAEVSWFRVVLDEAQSIKNHRTQVARACWGLIAKRRWCLSGTPIQNSIIDL